MSNFVWFLEGHHIAQQATLVCRGLLGLCSDNAHPLIVLALVWAPVDGKEVYKWTDPDGNVIYSDEPHPDAEIIDELEPQTYKAPRYAPGVLKPKPKKADAFAYKTVRIAAPANDLTIRDNAGQVGVAVFYRRRYKRPVDTSSYCCWMVRRRATRGLKPVSS